MKRRHWVILDVDRDNLIKMLTDEPFDVGIQWHGLQPHNINEIIKAVYENKDDIDRALDKAHFEANASIIQTPK